MRPESPLRGRLDEDDIPTNRGARSHEILSPETILGWGTSRAGLGLTLIGSIFLVIAGLMQLYLTLTLDNPAGFGRNIDDAFALIISQIMTYVLIMGLMMVALSLFFTGGASSESGALTWSVATRISVFLALLTVLAELYLTNNAADIRDVVKVLEILNYALFGVFMLITIFFSLYLRAVASYSGSSGFGAILLMLALLALIAASLLPMIDPTLIAPKLRNIISVVLLVVSSFTGAIVSGTTRSSLTEFLIRKMR